MKHLNLFKAAITLLAATAAGCGMPGGTSSIGPASSNIGSASSVTRPAAAPLAAPDAHKKLAGKYEGTIEWTIGSETISGTLSLILRFHNKNILGPFKITQNGETEHFRFYGRIKSKTADDALIIFLVYNKIKGGYATGSGNIVNGTFSADGKTKAVGSNPSIPIHFSVTKVPKS